MKNKLLALITIILISLPATASAVTGDDAKNFLIQKGALEISEYDASAPITISTLIKWTLKSLDYTPSSTDLNKKNICKDSDSNEENAYFRKAIEAGSLSFTALNPFCKPTKKVSRMEAINHVLNIFGVPVPKITTTELNLKDVTENAWFAPWIAKTIELNLLSPKSGNYFRPFSKITQEEAARLIYKTYYLASQIGHSNETEITLPDGDQIPHADILYDVWSRIITDYYYYDDTGLSEEDLAYEAIKGMVDSLNDPFSIFQSPEDNQIGIDILKGEFGGIGAYLEDKSGEVVIISVFQNSPAEKAGLKANDVIIGIDGQNTEGMTAEEIANLIRGDAGSQVEVKVRRQGQEKTFKITREIIEINYVNHTLLEDNIAYIGVAIFGDNTDEDFLTALEELLAEEPTGFIIDLRNNPGGYIDTTGFMLDHIIPANETMMYLRDSQGTYTEIVSEGPGELSAYPLVILINEGSASASEIFAGAIKDLELGTLIGQTSYGKGTAQELIEYQNGAMLKLTAAEWLTPNQESINHVGITPDITVELTQEDITNEKDPQLDRAIEEIKNQL